MIFRRKTSTTTSRMRSGRARAIRAAVVGTAGLATVGLALTGLFALGASASTQLPWASGVYLPNPSPASLSTFGTWRGAPLNVATVWPARASWNDFVNPAWLYRTWKGAPEKVVFGEPMLPENVSGVSIQACANGSYNSYWRDFGTNISAAGLGSSTVRLGWEFNGNWYIWRASNPATWVKCWHQIVTSARATAPGLQWDWNVNRGVSAGLADPSEAYPGNAYVNTIGVDSYDMYPAATTSAGWNKQLNGTQGLNYWLAFAKAHGKKFAVPEWGNITTTSAGGHDDQAYVNDMAGFFQAHAGSLAWESNYQGTDTGGGYRTGTRVPKAAAAYKADF